MKLISTLHEKLGDLWWYTILLFIAQRMGDVINMFVGLWLVPKYISQNELGAVLPLTQFVGLVGLPLGIVAIPFMKYLNLYAEKEEFGKVKALMRDVFIGTVILTFVSIGIAYFLLPILFVRVRVATGSLGLLIVGGSLLSAISVIFQNAVQGLKLFSTTVWLNVLAAPIRLILMLVFMPFRALSGYFVGQFAAPGVGIIGAIWTLRKRLGSSVRAESYWRTDGHAMVRYTIPIAILTITGVMSGTIDSLIIRHRLSDFESAGYYVITRFSDITSYLGSVFIIFLFPMVASRSANSQSAKDILAKTLWGSIVSGLLVALILRISGSFILGLQDVWTAYRPLATHMFWVCILNVLMISNAAFSTYESARGRFLFLWYVIPTVMVKSIGLYLLTGFSIFDGILPANWLSTIATFNPNRLGFIIAVLIVTQAIVFFCFSIDVLRSDKPTYKSEIIK